MAKRRTDLAVEAHSAEKAAGGEVAGVTAEESRREGFLRTAVEVLDEGGAAAIGKAVGRYITLELEGLLRREEDAFFRAVRALAHEVEALVPREGTVLVVGLGNRAITPDLVGPLAAEQLLVTRHLVEAVPEHFGTLRPVACFVPGVVATTGVESSAAVRALADALHPVCVIAVDALACGSLERLCRTVQLTDTGITPGSGVGNHRGALDRESLGVPVIAVGVPTVVDGATLVQELLGDTDGERPEAGRDFFVTPREVDSRVADLAKVIGYGVSMGLNPSLTPEELVMLLT